MSVFDFFFFGKGEKRKSAFRSDTVDNLIFTNPAIGTIILVSLRFPTVLF